MATDTGNIIRDSRKAAMSFLNAAKDKEERRRTRRPVVPPGGGSGGNSAVENFLSAGQRSAARTVAARNGEETDFDLAQRIRSMSDEDFDKAVVDGTLTPEQIRRAGEYEYDVWMGDVWMEGDHDDEPEPTYEEFMADPAKYGAVDDDPALDEYPRRWGRYNPARYNKQ